MEGASHSDPLADFSHRLKGLRAAHGWTLDELSERSGLSKPFLSRLEAGDRQPSIAAVLTLAKVFGVSIGSLFDSPAPRQACVVVRADEAPVRQGDGLTYRALSSVGRFANLQPIRITVSHNRKGDERYQHEGEEWLHLLSGRLRVQVADETYELERGDSAHFDSRQPHRLTALGGRDAELILVACPLPETNTTVTTAADLPRSTPTTATPRLTVRRRRAIR
jgi:transcriptional regulator with XRE-family HTH domain